MLTVENPLALSAYCVPGTGHASSDFIPKTLAGSRYNYPHLTDEKLSGGKCVPAGTWTGVLIPRPLRTERSVISGD